MLFRSGKNKYITQFAQREKPVTTAEGQRAGSGGLLRPLLAQPFYEYSLSSLKDDATTVDTSQHLLNKNYWKNANGLY